MTFEEKKGFVNNWCPEYIDGCNGCPFDGGIHN